MNPISVQRKISFVLYAQIHLSTIHANRLSNLGSTRFESDFTGGGCNAKFSTCSRHRVVFQTFIEYQYHANLFEELGGRGQQFLQRYGNIQLGCALQKG